ncbi:MAG: universal stress protein [Luteolibacter sp.]
MKTIIAAVDFSNATPAVAKMAVNIAKCFNANLQLFHVIEPEPGFTTYGFSMAEFPAMGEFRKETQRRAEQLMGELLTKVRAELPHVTTKMAEGAPLHELLKEVNESVADLVVVGSHGHGALTSLLLGSVAEGMLRKATVPTLVVPAMPV